jgi:uncharacterized protein (TIGR02231 family)
MKKLLIVLVTIVNAVWAQPEKTAESAITRVTVFLNRAQVVRLVKTYAEQGRNTIVVRGLPAQLDPQSLQVRKQGKVVLLGVSHRQSFLNELSMPPELKKLKDSLNYYNRQTSVVQHSKDVLQKEEQMLLANQRIGGANQNLSVNELKAMADYFRTRLNEIGMARLQADEKLSKLKERIDKLTRQYQQQNELYSRNTSEVLISLLAETTGSVQLELSYVVRQAGWQPVYDVRAANAGGPVQLQYKAQVYQSTGEDWHQVKLKLSTANPSLGGVKPELAVWYIDFQYPEAQRRLSESVRLKKQDMAVEAPDLVEESSLMTSAQYTRVVENALSTEFDIDLPYTIASSAQPVTVDIQQYEVPAVYRYATVPKLDGSAFLQAQITGWDGYNLLPGQAQVFFEDTYVGHTFINPAEVTDTLTVSLGRDPRVVVQRERKKDLTSRKVIGANIRETVAWGIALRNTRPEPVTIRVEDQVPVSRNSRIEVNLLEAGGASFDKTTGKLTWEVTLKPNEWRRLEFTYEIKYPKGMMINH